MIINQASLNGIATSFNTVFNEAFAGAVSQWSMVAMETLSAGRSVDYKWLGNFPGMRKWIDERAIKDLEGFSYEIENESWEATIEVDRDDIADDLIGVYRPMIQGLAQAAATHPDELVFQLLKAGFTSLCYDKQYFFDTDHPVNGASVSNHGGGAGTAWYLLDLSRPIKPIILQIRKRPEFVAMDRPDDERSFLRKKFLYGVDDRKNVGFGLWQLAYGSKQTLDGTAYAAARAAMMSFKNEHGRPLGIVPTHLVVPPTLESAGRKLLKNQQTDAGATNEWFNTAELVVVPWLA